jgi:ubiquinone/menaquinone biosynthesis C-methylase UbiE
MSPEPVPSDVETIKRDIVENWDRMAETWDAEAALVDRWFDPATRRLLEALELQPGQSVLELAAATGGFTKFLSRAVGPKGRVLATDTGAHMVRIGERRAKAAGLSNVTMRVMDGERPDVRAGSVDAVTCRQGFMFFSQPGPALGRLWNVLKPGGRIALSTFSPPDRNGLLYIPGGILGRWANTADDPPPPPGAPGPYSLSDPVHLEGLLTAAGFDEVRSWVVPCPLRARNLEELMHFYHTVLDDLVRDLSLDDQVKAWAEVARACNGFVGPSSAGAPSELLVVTGRRPVRSR